SGDGEVGDLATAFNEMAESLHAERERIELLYRSAERIAAESDVEELALLALEQLAALTGAQLGALYAGEGDDLRLAAQRGIPEGAIHPFARAGTATLGLPGESRLTLRQGDRTVGVLLVARSDGSELASDVLAAVESLA